MIDKNEWVETFQTLMARDTYQTLTEADVYTLTLADFLKMPDLDFSTLAKKDHTLSALFN
ncbi:MAG: hypothetical protein LHV69_01245 [Elusimicrobia bacterium]|nr:hypothetical protein [Candidatus Obscuribacterium magneticum]